MSTQRKRGRASRRRAAAGGGGARDAAWDAVQAQFRATRVARPPAAHAAPSAPAGAGAATLLILHARTDL